MESHAWLVNVARGRHIVTDDLVDGAARRRDRRRRARRHRPRAAARPTTRCGRCRTASSRRTSATRPRWPGRCCPSAITANVRRFARRRGADRAGRRRSRLLTPAPLASGSSRTTTSSACRRRPRRTRSARPIGGRRGGCTRTRPRGRERRLARRRRWPTSTRRTGCSATRHAAWSTTRRCVVGRARSHRRSPGRSPRRCRHARHSTPRNRPAIPGSWCWRWPRSASPSCSSAPRSVRPTPPARPDNILQTGSCVAIEYTGDAREVNCTGHRRPRRAHDRAASIKPVPSARRHTATARASATRAWSRARTPARRADRTIGGSPAAGADDAFGTQGGRGAGAIRGQQRSYP